jgi:cell division protein ZipA
MDSDSREWGVPPFEPLSIRTADFDDVHSMMPMMADSDPLDVTPNLDYDQHPMAAGSSRSPVPDAPAHLPSTPPPDAEVDAISVLQRPRADAALDVPPPENSGRFTTTGPQAPNVSEAQRIVTVRVCAEGESRWTGTELMAALENHGLMFGRYKVFHRKHSDGRTLFCAASLVEPGTFDIAQMPEDEFRGLTLFAILPGPAEPLQTIDVLMATAAELAETLHGTVQDSTGTPLSAQRAQVLREDVARFQASLTTT